MITRLPQKIRSEPQAAEALRYLQGLGKTQDHLPAGVSAARLDATQMTR
jgi:hypothetical protein